MRQIHFSPQPGSALMLTFFFIIVLTLEVAIVSLIAVRGFGEEGRLYSENASARQAADMAIDRLANDIGSYLESHTAAEVEADFTRGGSASSLLSPTSLTVTDPDTGTTDPTASDVAISAWVQDRNGNYYKIMARAQSPTVDITTQRWVLVIPTKIDATVVTGASGVPGATENAAIAATNDVFFANGNTMWAWKEGSGLSVLLSGTTHVAEGAVATASNGRAFFGVNDTGAAFRTWHEDTGLSVLVSGIDNPGYTSTTVGRDGRVFFGDTSKVYTWKSSTGLSVIVTAGVSPGASQGIAVSPLDSRSFFHGGAGSTNLYSWSPSSGLSIVDNAIANPIVNAVAAPDGRFYAGQNIALGTFYTWKAGEALTPIVSSVNKIGYHNTYMATDGRVYFGTSGSVGNTGQFFTYKNGTLTTILNNTDGVGDEYSAAVYSTNGIFIGQNSNPGSFWYYGLGSGLSVILSSADRPGYQGSIGVASDGRVFFGDADNFYTWKNGSGLSILVTNTTKQPGDQSVTVASDGRVFFGDNDKFYTWKPNTGLSVILTSTGNNPGEGSTKITSDGRVFYGNNLSYYMWKAAPPPP